MTSEQLAEVVQTAFRAFSVAVASAAFGRLVAIEATDRESVSNEYRTNRYVSVIALLILSITIKVIAG